MPCDAQLLADVYLAMTSGQVAFDLGFDGAAGQVNAVAILAPMVMHTRPLVLRASPEELLQHERCLDALDKSADGRSVWRRLG